MLLAIAFLMFAALLASWLVMPDGERVAITSPAESMSPEPTTAPSHA